VLFGWRTIADHVRASSVHVSSHKKTAEVPLSSNTGPPSGEGTTRGRPLFLGRLGMFVSYRPSCGLVAVENLRGAGLRLRQQILGHAAYFPAEPPSVLRAAIPRPARR
jgi:hypothetical protein